MLSELTSHALAGRCDPALVPFETTDQAPAGGIVVGQERAIEALRFGLERPENHVFLAGPSGSGRHRLVLQLAAAAAARRPPPTDLCYVFDFEAPDQPRALELPPGTGFRLRRALDELLGELQLALAAAFSSRDVKARHAEIDREFSERRREIEDDAARIAQWARERRKRRLALTRSVARRLGEEAFAEMRRRERLPEEADPFLAAVMKDVVERANDLGLAGRPGPSAGDSPRHLAMGRNARRYRVNVLTTKGRSRGHRGGPVVFEEHPTLERIFGRIETSAKPGAPQEAIRPGALHRAHGGILVLDAAPVLANHDLWSQLTRAMRRGFFQPVVPDTHLPAGPLPDPSPTPLTAQIVLIGDAAMHAQHCEEDEEFLDLFSVYADFDPAIHATPAVVGQYALHLADIAKQDGLRPFGRDAMARAVEHGMRVTGDRRRLTARTVALRRVLREADYLAGPDARCVESHHVEAAVEAARTRAHRPADQIVDDIMRHALRIDTDGVRIGQVNGMMVGSSGGISYAHPARITARVRLGEGDLIDIEREVELGGATHSKGILILSGFLSGRYAPDRPLSLWASLVFEQSYSGIDGDSASAAELACLLSAIARVPVTQSLAVTGSVDQHGDIQAVGDVNEKIEGFFDVCATRGLTGAHGIVVPAPNAEHVMLRKPVIAAADAGQFHIYTAETIDDVVAVLSGLPAGARNGRGLFPSGTFNHLVERRLLALAEERKAYRAGDEEDDG